jgi:hypothetical protein
MAGQVGELDRLIDDVDLARIDQLLDEMTEAEFVRLRIRQMCRARCAFRHECYFFCSWRAAGFFSRRFPWICRTDRNHNLKPLKDITRLGIANSG